MFLGKEVRVILKGEALSSYLELKKRDDKISQGIARSIDSRIQLLKDNPQYGDPIAKNLIPDEFKKIGIKNLYRIELPNYWRMLYTLEGTRVEIFLFVLSISDHPSYDKKFGYRKK
jgi:hypothetical protein